MDDSGYRVESATPRPGTVSLVLPSRSRGATVAAMLRAVTTGRPLRLGEPNLSPEVLCMLDALRTVGWESRADERDSAALARPAHWGGNACGRIHSLQTPAEKRKALQLELPPSVALASVAGVLVGELATGKYPRVDLDELKTLTVPIMFGMSCRSLITYFARSGKAAQGTAKYVPGFLALLIGVLIAGGTTYFGT